MAVKNLLSLFGSSCMLLLVGAALGYSLYLDTNGVVTTGQVYRKSESVSIHDGDWSRSLKVLVQYKPAGEFAPRYVGGNLDAETFDRLRVGSIVSVRYMPWRKLRDIPLIPIARLADQSTFSLPKDKYAPIVRFVAVLLGIVALFVLWLKMHINAAGWLLLPVLPLAFVYFFMPAEEKAPAGAQRLARASVNQIEEVTEVLQTNESPGVDTRQPFQIVELQFVPEGRTEPVIGVDKIDSGSFSGLAKGSVVEVRYQADNPRIVRINGGERTFPRQALISVAIDGGEATLVIVILSMVGLFFKTLWKGLLNRYGGAVDQARRRRKQ